eukprot:scaffold6883_cov91-Phaeocystis_antarctica.AAC.2
MCREICGLCSGLCYEKQEICSPQNSAGHVLGSARRNLKCAFGIWACNGHLSGQLWSSTFKHGWGASKSIAPFLDQRKGSMVGFISNLAPLLNYLPSA